MKKGAGTGPLRWLRASVGDRVQLISVEAVDFLRSDQKHTLVAWRADVLPVSRTYLHVFRQM